MPPITPEEFHDLCFIIVTFVVSKMLSLLYALNGLIEENKRLRALLWSLQRRRNEGGDDDDSGDGGGGNDGKKCGKGGGKRSEDRAPITPT